MLALETVSYTLGFASAIPAETNKLLHVDLTYILSFNRPLRFISLHLVISKPITNDISRLLFSHTS
jgi:hypothetical protein